MKKVFAFIFIIFFLYACKKENDVVEFGYEYFPLEEGVFVEYKVMEVRHDIDLDPQHDTISYKLETLVGEEVLDNSGRLARKLYRNKYDLATGEILDQRVWTKVIDGRRGEIVEENQRKIRLVFPVKVDNEWDVNAFNVDEPQKVYYEDVNVKRIVNGHVLDHTAKIIYDDFLSLVDYQKSHEIYAKDIGLVERRTKDFVINNFDTLNIKKGKEVHYKLLDFGRK